MIMRNIGKSWQKFTTFTQKLSQAYFRWGGKTL